MPHRTHAKHVSRQSTISDKGAFKYVIYFFTFATPLFELPQAYTIYTNHSAANVSVLTWGFFVIDNIVWIIYAMKRHLRPLLITSILYLIIEMSVVIGIILYS